MPKLTDDEAYERLHAALLALGRGEGVTARGDTALKAGRRALHMLELGLLKAIEEGSDDVDTVRNEPPRQP